MGKTWVEMKSERICIWCHKRDLEITEGPFYDSYDEKYEVKVTCLDCKKSYLSEE